MITTSVKFSAHVIHELLRNTLIVFIVIFIALFLWLKVGIKADTLVLGKYKISKLYIKLDKKLTLQADKILIPKIKKKPSLDNIDKTFDKIKYLLTFFDTIDLKNIIFENNTMNVLFVDDLLYVTSDAYEAAGMIHRDKKQLNAKISMLYVKKHNITFDGNLSYDLDNHHLISTGNVEGHNIKGTFDIEKMNDKVSFDISTSKFTDLKTLIETIPMSAGVKSWTVDKVQAQKYKLNSLTGSGYLTDEGFKVDFDTLSADMLFEKVKIYYKEGLEPILADSFVLNYKDFGLYFDLKNPSYKNRSLKGSQVSVVNLGKKTMLKLDLHINTPIDKVLHTVLKSYDITIPVKHKGKNSKLDIKLDIALGKKHKHKKTVAIVDVHVGKGDIWYKNIKLPLLGARVSFDNRKKESIKVKATLNKGTVMIGKTNISVRSGKGSYYKDKVTLDDVHIKSSWYEGKVSGAIALKQKKANLDFMAKHITIGDKKKVISLKNRLLPLVLDYGNNVQVNVPTLGLKIVTEKDSLVITAKTLKKLKPFIVNNDMDFDDGYLVIKTSNEARYTFKGTLKRNACFFYDKKGLCHTQIPCYGSITKEGLDFYAFDKRLHYSSKKSRMTLNNIHIDLEKLLEGHNKSKKAKTKAKKLVILGKNSKLHYGEYTLHTDSYDIEISPKGNIKAMGSLNGDIVKFSKKGKDFSLKAFRIQDTMLHPLIGFDGLKEGRYTLKKSGNPDKTMKGQIIVEGGIVSDFKAYNNTLAFVNALPAIATLSNPGFSEKGFQIIEGLIEYRMLNSNKIIFDSIYIKGHSSTIVGKGEIDIKNNSIDMKLAIQTARELGSIVGSLPLLGYILMGKDKSMTVGLEVTGSLSQPKVQTSAAEDIITLPLQLIKRTLESPAHIINK